MADLVARMRLWELGVIAAGRDLVGCTGEGEDRLRQAARQVPPQAGGDREAHEERDRHASEQDDPPLLQLLPRLRHYQRAERVAAERDRISGREVRAVGPRRRQLEGLPLPRVEERLVEE